MNFPFRGVLLAACALWLAGCDAKKPAAKPATGAGSGTPLTAPLDYLEAQGRAKQASLRVISLAQLQQAVQQFYGMEERWPRDFAELVEKRYLTALPAAPDGYAYTYDPRSGSVRAVRVAPGGTAPARPPAGGPSGVLQRARQLPGAGPRQ